MTRRFAVVHEADADFKTATDLADRVLLEAIDWLDVDLLSAQRMWLAEATEKRRRTWKGIKQLARAADIRVRGHFDGEPGQPDAVVARRAILFVLEVFPDLDGILLIRDQDNDLARRQGLEQARGQNKSGVPIIVGLAVVERECWVICGFDPQNDIETTRLDAERMRLGFDPRSRSHQLTACKDNKATRSPKRVLGELCGGEKDREHRCWQGTSLDDLRKRGLENGLATYLEEIRNRLACLIGHVAAD